MVDNGQKGDDLQNQIQSNEEVASDSGLYDSEYNFSNEEDVVDKGSGDARDDAEKTIEGAISIPQVYGEIEEEIEDEYGALEEFYSSSLTDERMIATSRPKYARFSEVVNIEDTHFKIGMKFISFKLFRDTVRNYGIKHRFVMNFRLSNNRRC